MKRPHPPSSIFDVNEGEMFVPAPEVISWARKTFIDEGASLENPEHVHLREAVIGALWTNVPNAKGGRTILAQAEKGDPMAMGKWAKARARLQVVEWFGEIPDFILTFDAGYADTCSDAEFSAIVEHELLHCSQERDSFGEPKFSQSTGKPVWAIRGHDYQGFISIARRYGAIEPGVSELFQALQTKPTLSDKEISIACGTCGGR